MDCSTITYKLGHYMKWILLLLLTQVNLIHANEEENDWSRPVIVDGQNTDDAYDLGDEWEDPYKDFEHPQEQTIFKVLKYYGRLKTLDLAVGVAVDQVNDKIIEGTFNHLFLNKLKDKARRKLRVNLLRGTSGSLPISLHVVPIARSEVFASRSMDLDAYSGSQKKIHLIDEVGFNFKLGAELSVNGLYDFLYVENKAITHYQRSYKHIRPMKSINNLINYPYRNSVPLDRGELFQKPIFFSRGDVDFNATNLDRDELDKFYKNLKNKLKVGESVIITDSFGKSFNIKPGAELAGGVVDTYVRYSKGRVITSRIQVYRKGEDEFDIYKDSGNSSYYNLGYRFKLILPIYSWDKDLQTGQATIRYFNLRYLAYQDRDAYYQKLLSLKYMFHTGSISGFKYKVSPYTITHDFSDSVRNRNYVWRAKRNVNKDGTVSIKFPKGNKETFYISSSLSSRGKDKFKYTRNSMDSIVDTFLFKKEDDFYDIFNEYKSPITGWAQVQETHLEAKVYNDKNKRIDQISDATLKLKTQWRGWYLSKSGAQGIFNFINKKYNKNLKVSDYKFPLNLYTIDVDNKVNINNLVEVMQGGHIEKGHRLSSVLNLPSLRKNYQNKPYPILSRKLKSITRNLFYNNSTEKFFSFFGAKQTHSEVTIKAYNFNPKKKESILYQNKEAIYGQSIPDPLKQLKEKLNIPDSVFNAHWIRPFI